LHFLLPVCQSFGAQFAIPHDSTHGAAALTFRGFVLIPSRRVAFGDVLRRIQAGLIYILREPSSWDGLAALGAVIFYLSLVTARLF